MRRVESPVDRLGWHAIDAKGIWRPGVDPLGYHEISFGFHHDLYTLKNPVFNTSNWQSGNGQSIFSNSTGKTQTEGYWIEDAWDFHEDWNFTVGGRLESWHAYDGFNATIVNIPANGSIPAHTELRTVDQANKSSVNFSPIEGIVDHCRYPLLSPSPVGVRQSSIACGVHN